MPPYDRNFPRFGKRVFGLDEVKLISKNRTYDGFNVEEDAEIDPLRKAFIDDTKKLIINNAAPYGHVITGWLYLLLLELEESQEPITVFFYKSPDTRDMRMEHSSNLTEYLHERLVSLGHTVRYIDADEFYINNFTIFHEEIHFNPAHMDIVSKFLSEGLDYTQPPAKKIYLSRAKTTTYNGNRNYPIPHDKELLSEELRQIRDENIYSFSNRIDDEKALEEYLKTLGFIIYYPEDTESYKDQLQLFASSKIVMSLTSSALSICSVMAPNTFIVELVTPMYTQVDRYGNFIDESINFHDIYKNISTLKSNLYMGISNKYHKTSNVIESIEGNPGLKSFLSS